MTRFIQLHTLTVYPLSNPNRDDTGRPKSANYGGVPRLRMSSQSLKRAIRTSGVFQDELSGHLGERTQRIGDAVVDRLIEKGIDDPEQQIKIASAIADVFGKLDTAKKDKGVRTLQLAFISPDERAKAIELADRAAAGEKLPTTAELKKEILRTSDGAADIAMFGRMLADDAGFNREAAVQVSHAFTTHRVVVEDDFYTAVDDLKEPAEEDAGASFIGETGFGSGVFYLYSCIDRDLLEKNLDGDSELASRAISAFVAALTTATPAGKRTSFAHQTRASFLLAEKGEQQTRSLAAAFLTGAQGEDLLGTSIEQLQVLCDSLDRAYGPCADERKIMDVTRSTGTLAEICDFASESAQ